MAPSIQHAHTNTSNAAQEMARRAAEEASRAAAQEAARRAAAAQSASAPQRSRPPQDTFTAERRAGPDLSGGTARAPGSTLATENRRDGQANCLDTVGDKLASDPALRADSQVVFLRDTRPGAEGATGHVVLQQGDRIWDPATEQWTPTAQFLREHPEYQVAGTASGEAVHSVLEAPPGPERQAALARSGIDPALVSMNVADPSDGAQDPEGLEAFLDGPGWTEVDVTNFPGVGQVNYQNESSYTQSYSAVAADTESHANWCASAAFDLSNAGLSGWATPELINEVLRQHQTSSSSAVWRQVMDPAASDPSALVQLTGADASAGALNFRADRPVVVNDFTDLYTPAGEMIPGLADIPEGEMRMVVMRPLDSQGNPSGTGHWVMVQNLGDEGFRLVQSAPDDWALLGGDDPNRLGGLYEHRFETLDELNTYLHAETRYASDVAGMNDYGVVVLEPVTPRSGR